MLSFPGCFLSFVCEIPIASIAQLPDVDRSVGVTCKSRSRVGAMSQNRSNRGHAPHACTRASQLFARGKRDGSLPKDIWSQARNSMSYKLFLFCAQNSETNKSKCIDDAKDYAA